MKYIEATMEYNFKKMLSLIDASGIPRSLFFSKIGLSEELFFNWKLKIVDPDPKHIKLIADKLDIPMDSLAKKSDHQIKPGYSNFNFLEKDFPELSEWGKKAERSYIVDSDLCVSALQILAELLISNIFEMEDLYCPNSTHFDRIEALQDHYANNLLLWDDWSSWDDLYDFLHALRKATNEIKHKGGHCAKENARIFLKNSLVLCCWFQKKYGSDVTVPSKFYEPKFSQQNLFQKPILARPAHTELQEISAHEIPKSLSATSQRSTATSQNFSVKSYFESKGFEVIDKRISGGCLWVVGDETTLRPYVKEIEDLFEISGTFCGGGRATSYRRGWFTKSKK